MRKPKEENKLIIKNALSHIREVISLLEPREKRSLSFVFFGAILMALIQIIGVGSIMPFVAVAVNPEIIYTNEYLSRAFEFFGFTSETVFLVVLGIGVLVFVVLTSFARVILDYMQVKFTSMRQHSLGCRLMDGYLRQNYAYFLNKNSYEFIKNIRNEIPQIIDRNLVQFIDFVAKAVQIVFIVFFLFLVDLFSTFIISASVALIYGATYLSLRKKLDDLGIDRYELTRMQAKAISEAFWGIKELKLMGLERSALQRYDVPSFKAARNRTIIAVLSDIPKFILEATAFSGMMSFMLYKILRSGGFADAAPVVTLYAYASYRLIPAVQGLFKALTNIRYGAPTAYKIIQEFSETQNGPELPKNDIEILPFKSSLDLKNLDFTYPGSERKILKSLQISIPHNSTIGIAGKTGAGKTTLIDILLGLLPIQNGVFEVDGVRVNSENIRSWQKNIGYVPQVIYLANNTVASNIAFGVPKAEMDLEAIRSAAKLAQIHDFIETGMPEKYDTFVGERGIKLSGGQQQRIGIARALYRNPSLLIFDEATSSLDTHTEGAVMDAIDALMGIKTIIIIAHRLSTLKKCDTIYLLRDGEIVDSGIYDDLIHKNSYFKN